MLDPCTQADYLKKLTGILLDEVHGELRLSNSSLSYLIFSCQWRLSVSWFVTIDHSVKVKIAGYNWLQFTQCSFGQFRIHIIHLYRLRETFWEVGWYKVKPLDKTPSFWRKTVTTLVCSHSNRLVQLRLLGRFSFLSLMFLSCSVNQMDSWPECPEKVLCRILLSVNIARQNCSTVHLFKWSALIANRVIWYRRVSKQ